ncbi:MAG: HD-GYP domain-containing protein [Rhodoferax sp.]
MGSLQQPSVVRCTACALSRLPSASASSLPDVRPFSRNCRRGSPKLPISARLMAIADVYDALISRRVYKEGMAHDKAVTIIVEGRGGHFDADMVDAFLDIQDEFRSIAQRFSDSDQDIAKKAEYIAQSVSGSV